MLCYACIVLVKNVYDAVHKGGGKSVTFTLIYKNAFYFLLLHSYDSFFNKVYTPMIKR